MDAKGKVKLERNDRTQVLPLNERKVFLAHGKKIPVEGGFEKKESRPKMADVQAKKRRREKVCEGSKSSGFKRTNSA